MPAPRPPLIYGCPARGADYVDSLYAAVRRLGVEVREAIWAGRWLLGHLRRGDTLHLHWPSFHYYDPASRAKSTAGLIRFVVILLLLRARGVRLMWTAHNLYPHDGTKGEWMHRLARRTLVRLVECVFVDGPTAAGLVSREFSLAAQQVRVVRRGNWIGKPYANSTTRTAARADLGLPADAFVLLFVGLCKPYKGLEDAIRAMASQRPGALLVIAGKFQSPAYETTIAALARDAGVERVRLIPGFIEDARMQTFMNAADAVVLPYRAILSSGVAMVALGFGRPVIAPRMGALVDLIRPSCGVLYDSCEPEGLAKAMAAARTMPFSEREIVEYAMTCTWDAAAQALVDAHRGTASTAAGREVAAQPK